MRHSIAWPRSTTSSWVNGSGSPAATADAGLDDVDAGGHLGHAVLDLDARVHLEEEVLAVGEQSLDRCRRRGSRRRARRSSRSCRSARAARRRRSTAAPATPRSASGGGAGSSSRARRGARRCRARRRAPAPRRGAGRAGSARGRRSASPKNFSPSRAAPSNASASSPAAQRDAEALAAAAAGGLDRDRVADARGDRSCALRPTVLTGSVVPGTIGTPAAAISSRARVFDPIASIADAGGPMKTMPSSSQRAANAAFSARKP